MAHMTLPAEHSEADCRLAEQIGRTFGLDEVHVFWTLPVPAEPAEESRPNASPDPATGLLGTLAAVVTLVAQLGGSVTRRTRGV